MYESSIENPLLYFSRRLFVALAGLFFLYFCALGAARAELVIGHGVSRVIFPQTTDKMTLRLANSEATDYLVIHTVLDADGRSRTNDFIVTPEVRELKSGSESQMVLRRITSKAPTDRESLYLLDTRLIPKQAAEKKHQSGMDMMYAVQQKILLRPEKLKVEESTAGAHKTLEFVRDKSGVKVINHSPYVRVLNSLTLDGQSVEVPIAVCNVPPFGEMHYPTSHDAKLIEWTLINDLGFPTQVQQSPLNHNAS